VIAAVALAGALAAATPARAQNVASRPMILTFDPGVCLMWEGRFFSPGASPLVAYLGGTLQLDLPRPIAANIFVGLGGCLGAVVGGTVRYASPWAGAVRVTAGGGPMLGVVAFAGGTATLAEGDVALEIRSRPGFVVVLGPKLAVTLNRSGGGDPHCVDECPVDLPAGTYTLLFRMGVGFNI
jgi:hypothetical protein